MSSFSETKGGDDKSAAGNSDNKKTVSISRPALDCKVTSVVVFRDRAEVTRRLVIDVAELGGPGDVDLSVEGFPASIDETSVRVKATGPAVIQEVSYQRNTKSKQASAEDEGKKAELAARIDEIRSQLRKLDQELQVVNESRDLAASYVKSMMNPAQVMTDGAASPPPAAAGGLQLVNELLTFHAKKRQDFDQESNRINDRKAEAESELAAAGASLRDLTGGGLSRGGGGGRGGYGGGSPDVVVSHDVNIGFEVLALQPQQQQQQVTADLTYIVRNASWSPSYDIRISSEDNGMAITYHAQVKQSTGEDWNGVELSLSTAQPCAGDNTSPPDLPTLTAQFKQPRIERLMLRSGRMHRTPSFSGHLMQAEMAMDAFGGNTEAIETLGASAAAPAVPAAPAATMTTKVSGGDGLGSATFSIPRAATIESDNKPHKVTVAILNLESTFIHFAVPAVNPNVFLQARTENTSNYPLLPSNKVSVFFDGSFVATTDLDHVSPGESFRSFLGVDPSVKLEYRPVRIIKAAKGMFTKKEVVTYERLIAVTNTKKQALRIGVSDQYPTSSDAKISVTLLKPTPAELKAGAPGAAAGEDGDKQSSKDTVQINAVSNNIVFTRTIAPQERVELPFVYSIESPLDKEVELVEP